MILIHFLSTERLCGSVSEEDDGKVVRDLPIEVQMGLETQYRLRMMGGRHFI